MLNTDLKYAPNVAWDHEVKEYLQAALGSEQFHRTSTALCQPPKNTCLRVNTLRTSPQEVVDALAQADEGAASAAKPFAHPQVPIAVLLPGQGPLAVDCRAADGKEVIISRKTGEAVLRGAPVFAPGVLACSKGVSAGHLVAVWVAVEKAGSDWCGITRGTTLELGQAADTLAVATGSTAQPLCVGLGRTCMSRAQMFGSTSGLAVEMVQPLFRVPPFRGQGLEGKVMLQNLPSIVAALALNPAPGSRVLDMCAAPGGKTTLLAQLMHDQGEVIALDRSYAKVQEILSLASELGLTCITAHKMDACKAVLPDCGTTSHVSPSPLTRSQTHEDTGAQDTHHSTSQPAEERSGNTCQPCTGPPCSSPQTVASQSACSTSGLVSQMNCSPSQSPDQRNIRPAESEECCVSPQTPAVNEKVLRRQQRREANLRARGLPVLPKLAMQPGPACPGFPPESFDYILLDAPCSALGLRPRLLQPASLKYLQISAAFQRELMDTAVRLLKPGGALVYSTCTINPGENEANVRYLLDKYGQLMRLVAAEPKVGGPGLVGSCRVVRRARAAPLTPTDHDPSVHVSAASTGTAAAGRSSHAPVACCNTEATGLVGNQESCQSNQSAGSVMQASQPETAEPESYVEQYLSEDESQLVQRFDPSGSQDTIGFFIARFEKTASCCPG